MCGIAGYFLFNGVATSQNIDIQVMTDILTHRGPDDYGFYIKDGVALGHRRLAIIDLSSRGHQPMISNNGRYCIVYNGEIYNYRELKSDLSRVGVVFHTDSDTEVILAAYETWGADCVRRFNGMWAFCVWDTQERKMFCSRDRFGVKPFYYYMDAGLFLFASEPKAITGALTKTKAINYDYLYYFLSNGILFDAESTFYEEIKCLLPAHNCVIDCHGIKTYRYWDYPSEKIDTYDYSDPVGSFRDLLWDAVRLRSRSDVEIGTTLSGGLDSSAIVAIFRELFPKSSHRTFSAVFREEGCDESEYMEEAVNAYRLDPTYISPNNVGLFDTLKSVVKALDSPILSPATFPLWKIMYAAHNAGIKVLLDGQGADELLAGYDYQLIPAYIHSLFRRAVQNPTKENITEFMAQSKPWLTLSRVKWMVRYLLPFTKSFYRHGSGATNIFTAEYLSSINKGNKEQEIVKYGEPLNNALYQTHSKTILPGLLHYGDAISMAFSVEYRAPFMDYRLVEYCFGLGHDKKINNGYTKYLLRESMRGTLVDSVRLRKSKYGFNTPLYEWLSDKDYDQFLDILNSKRSKERGVFDVNKLQAVMKQGRETRQRLGNYMLRWVSTELWMQECIDA